MPKMPNFLEMEKYQPRCIFNYLELKFLNRNNTFYVRIRSYIFSNLYLFSNLYQTIYAKNLKKRPINPISNVGNHGEFLQPTLRL